MIFFVKKYASLFHQNRNRIVKVIMAKARPLRALRKLSDEERARALGRTEADIHPQDVAIQFNVHRSTIIRLRDRAKGTVSDQP